MYAFVGTITNNKEYRFLSGFQNVGGASVFERIEVIRYAAAEREYKMSE
jgi:hypothetical protein